MSLERLLDEAQGRQLPALIDEWSREDDERRWIARALRIDLALLVAHPELVIPALHRRCAFDSSDFAGSPSPLPAALRAAVSAWTWTWSEARTWLRSVRAARLPMPAGLLEEYRTSRRGELWGDGETIGVGDAIAWERVTGRIVARTHRSREPRWQFSGGSRGSVGVTRIGESTWRAVALEGGDTPEHLVELDDHLVIINATGTGRDDAARDAYYVIDADAGAIVWRGLGRVTAATHARHGILLVTPGGLALHDRASGKALARWGNLPIEEMTCLASGAIVTRAGDLIRVWDHTAMPAMVPATPRDNLVLMSPDRSRVLSEGILRDGLTGRHIALIQSTEQASDEAPAGAWQLHDNVLVRCLPPEVEMWSTFDGERHVLAIAARVETGDRPAINATGNLLAVARPRRGTIELSTLHTNLGMSTQSVAFGRHPRIGFSPDGKQLWWVDATGARFAMDTAELAPRQLADDEPLPEEPPPRLVAPRDGLVTVDGLVAITDDRELIASPDGEIVVGPTTHLVRSR